MNFKVIDKNTGLEPDVEELATEPWANHLLKTDISGFLLEEDGTLLLADDRYHIVVCPADRFEIIVNIDKKDVPSVCNNSEVRHHVNKLLQEACPTPRYNGLLSEKELRYIDCFTYYSNAHLRIIECLKINEEVHLSVLLKHLININDDERYPLDETHFPLAKNGEIRLSEEVEMFLADLRGDGLIERGIRKNTYRLTDDGKTYLEYIGLIRTETIMVADRTEREDAMFGIEFRFDDGCRRYIKDFDTLEKTVDVWSADKTYSLLEIVMLIEKLNQKNPDWYQFSIVGFLKKTELFDLVSKEYVEKYVPEKYQNRYMLRDVIMSGKGDI